jgi:hypothetical protein
MSACALSWSVSVTWTRHRIWLTRPLPGPGHRGARSAGIRHRRRGYPSSCQDYRAGRSVLSKVFPSDYRDPAAGLMIRPSALPTGAAVYLNDTSNPYGYIGLQMGLVRASKRCTGS